MKSEGVIRERAHNFARKFWLIQVILTLALLVSTYFFTDILDQLGVNPGIVPITGFVTMLLTGTFLNRKMIGWAFAMTGTTVALTLTTAFMIMFPRVMISTLNPEWSLTIYNASSSAYTLQVMTIVALVFTPIVLAYQAWTYWVFRKRVSADPKTLTY
jgi:cytochrome d ubiquinol oxidase subunit II